MRNKRVLFFLATEKGYRVLQRLIESDRSNYVSGVVSFHEINMQKDYFDDIKNLCDIRHIPFHEWKNIKTNIPGLIHELKATNCIAISWRYLLPLSINEYLDDDLIILHDSLLPKYRGFSPLVTAILNGDTEVGVSALFATEMADCGEIIAQKSFCIDETLKIQQVIERMAELYAELVLQVVDHIIENNITSIPQNEAEATYSIWRDEDDYWIDWRWSASKIFRFINALGFPFRGAKTKVDGSIIRIIDCSVEDDKQFAIRTPGKIWSLQDGVPSVVCGEGMLKILNAVDEEGKKYKFMKLRNRIGGGYET